MRQRWVLVLAVLLFVPGACVEPVGERAVSSVGEGTASSAGGGDDVDDGVVRIQACEPRSLVPASVTTECGGQVASAMFDQLVEVAPATGRPSWGPSAPRAVARSIQSPDGRSWVIDLKRGRRFHDGELVTAAAFANAWNRAALAANAQPTAFLFDDVIGFDDLQCDEVACEPGVRELRGLRVVGRWTLIVRLEGPDADFPRRLGHLAFSPLPPAAFEDPAGFEEQPVGNGPYRLDGVWEHDERLRLVRFEDHPSDHAGPEVVDLLLADVPGVVRAVARGEVDLATRVPRELPDPLPRGVRRRVVSGDDYVFLVAPAYLPQVADPHLLAGLSMAIDRPAIVRDHLDGRAQPARGLVPPVASDAGDRCGIPCRFDDERARQQLGLASVPEEGIELWYDASFADGWPEEIARQWRRTLGDLLGPVRTRALTHEEYVAHLEGRRIGGLHVLGWSMDVQSPREYLTQLHGPTGLFNFDRYRESDVDELLEAAGRALGMDEALDRWLDVERAVLDDWHHIPLWVGTHDVLVGQRVGGIVIDGHGRVRLTDLRIRD